jgi:hypothetical protein
MGILYLSFSTTNFAIPSSNFYDEKGTKTTSAEFFKKEASFISIKVFLKTNEDEPNSFNALFKLFLGN